MYYLINEILTETDLESCTKGTAPYVALLDKETYIKEREVFGFGIDIDSGSEEIHLTKAEVNYDSLVGTFSVPDRRDIFGHRKCFRFVLDEKGVVFVDDGESVKEYIDKIKRTKKWRFPSLERFIFDFLESLIHGDLELLEFYEKELDEMEDELLKGDIEDDIMERLNDIRGKIQDLKTHYEQLLDFSQELTENENNFFKPENLRYFRLYSDRLLRLKDIVSSLKDHTMQVRDLYHYQMEVSQNRLMSILTIVATIFMPLTLIAGWYGMNFKYMPELEQVWSYPAVILISIVIAISEIVYFKKKKWL